MEKSKTDYNTKTKTWREKNTFIFLKLVKQEGFVRLHNLLSCIKSKDLAFFAHIIVELT